MSSIDEIKSRIDIVDLVSETVQLRRSGKNYTGFCPFHPNTRTPAFVVFPESGTWRCFGQCNEGGDIFGYVMKKEGWDFAETLRHLAERAGVQLKPVTEADKQAAEEHDNLRLLLEEAVTYYRNCLLNTSAGKAALEYLRKRGLNDDTIEAFGLGYAPNSWEETSRRFTGKGYPESDLLAAGLVSERESAPGEPPAGIFDRFRHRIMFPIRDERGRMAGFGARILDPNDVPKFLNSPQSVLFDKSHLLYGLDQARKPIRAADQAVIVEGYLDVIALHQAGFTNAVSPMGTALTGHQLLLLKKFTRRFILALDPDAAGDKATLRGLQVARQAFDRESDPVFDARGLLGHEARLKADIRVTTLPPGMDPDDVVKRDPQEWLRIIAQANPIVVHVMQALAAGRDLEDAKVKADLARQVLPLIEEVPDPVERESYRQKLARFLKVDERSLALGVSTRPPLRARRPRSTEAQTTPAEAKPVVEPRSRLEAHALGIFLRRPDLVYRVDRSLQEDGLARLVARDFLRSDYQAIFDLVLQSLEQDEAEPIQWVLNRLSLPLMDVADELLKLSEKLDPVEDRVLEDIMRTILTMRRRFLTQTNEHYMFLQSEAHEAGDWQTTDFSQSILQNAIALRRLDQSLDRYTNRSTLSSLERRPK